MYTLCQQCSAMIRHVSHCGRWNIRYAWWRWRVIRRRRSTNLELFAGFAVLCFLSTTMNTSSDYSSRRICSIKTAAPSDFSLFWHRTKIHLLLLLLRSRVSLSDARKFDHGLSRLMHTDLHWLDVPERVKYKLGVLMYRCQHNQAPRCLMDHCSPVSDVVFRQRLRSIRLSSHQLSVPRYVYGRRALSVAGPTVWNSSPELPSGSGVLLCWQLQAVAEDISIFAVLVCPAH